MVKPFLADALFALSFLSTPCLVAGERQCYLPNGELAANHFPCNSEAGGPCCDAGWACLDKNLCSGPKKEVIRGSCTDKKWVPNANGGICNRWCFGDQGAPGALLVRTADGNENETGASWRCDKTEIAGAQFYWMDWKVMQTVAVFDSTQQRFNLMKSSSASPSASQTPSTDSSGSASSSPSQTTGAALSVDASSMDSAATQRTAAQTESESSGATDTGSPSGSGSTSQLQSPTDGGLSTAAIAGIGASIGVLVLMVALLAFLLWRKKRARDDETTRAELDSNHGQGAAWGEKGPAFELPATPYNELCSSSTPAPLHPWNSAAWNRKELPADFERTEMDAGYYAEGNRKELPTEFERMEMDAGYYACAELSDGSSWTASQAETMHGSPQTTKSSVETTE